MIPIDRVRELLDDVAQACGDSDCLMHPCAKCCSAISAHNALRAAAPDLARDVLTLADALETAERERDTLRRERAAVDAIALEVTRESMAAGRRDADVIEAMTSSLSAERRVLAGVRSVLALALSPQGTAAVDVDALSTSEMARRVVAERDTARSAIDELVFRDYAAEVESYSETAPGSHAAAQVRAADAYSALVKLRDAWREAQGAIATRPTVAAEAATGAALAGEGR